MGDQSDPPPFDWSEQFGFIPLRQRIRDAADLVIGFVSLATFVAVVAIIGFLGWLIYTSVTFPVIQVSGGTGVIIVILLFVIIGQNEDRNR